MGSVNSDANIGALVNLVEVLSEETKKYVSLAQEGSEKNNESLQEQADLIGKACGRLQAMVSEPSHWMAEAAWSYFTSVALSITIDLDIPNIIDAGSKGTSIDHLAEQTGASPGLIRRIMRQCVNRSIFAEISPGCYVHNRHSLRLLDDNFRSLIHYVTEDGLRCGTYLPQKMLENKYRILPDARAAAFCIAFQTELPLYEYYHSVDIKRGQRFARGMAGHYNSPLSKPIESIFPFQNLPVNSVLVDIGGGNGQQAIRLTTLYPQVSCVVQDHDSVIASAQKAATVSTNVAQRITWQAHDFYSPQPCKAANVYLLSHIMMDNTDENCAKIIRHLVQAMDPGSSKLLVHDFLDPKTFGDDRHHVFDMLDMHMISSLSVPSRNEAEWDSLMSNIDERLVRSKTWTSNDGSAVLEFRLN